MRMLHAALCAALLSVRPALADTVFLSTQMRPIEEAQKVRDVILKGFPSKVEYVTDFPPQLPVRIQAEQAGTPTISLVGALHGELAQLANLGLLAPLDALAAKVDQRGIPADLLKLGRFGGEHQLYIPWMQASYIMVANKQALPFLPKGADPNTLTYAQLAEWGTNIQTATGKRMVGFPAGPQGLMARFFEGYLYPSFTGGIVAPFRSPEAEAMWTQFAALWKTVSPNSTSYNFMQEPLLAGDVWIAWDHVVRVLDALRQKPDEFIAFPAPAGPKGRGVMPVLAGLAVVKNAPDAAGADALVQYLARPETQIATTRAVGFFPVVKADLPADLDAGVRLGAGAIERGVTAPDALVSLLPVGLGQRGGEFDKIFLDTFQRIVLRSEAPRAVLDRQGPAMQRILTETNAPCWTPDPVSAGACQVR